MDYNKKYNKYKTKYLSLKYLINNNSCNHSPSKKCLLCDYVQNGGNNKISDKSLNSPDKPTLYLFKADWCGYCQAFKNDWLKLNNNEQLKKKINFITLDDHKNKDIINKWDIKGYPTLILKNNTNPNPIEYMDNKTYNNVKSFIENNI